MLSPCNAGRVDRGLTPGADSVCEPETRTLFWGSHCSGLALPVRALGIPDCDLHSGRG